MKFLTFRGAEGRLHPGVAVDGGVLDLLHPALRLPEPCGCMGWWDLDDPWHQAARRAAAAPPEEAVLPAGSISLQAPVPRPGKFLCIGLNYRDHAEESGMEVPESPVCFSKFGTSVIGPEAPVLLPPGSRQVDYEAELGVVVGRRLRQAMPEEALAGVLGYTCINDVSARDFQFADGQWQRGKSCDTFGPMGPWIVSPDEAGDPQDLAIRFRLNGATLQDSSTSQLIFGVAELLSFLSGFTTLEPGDVIATGTPPGVGFARKPPVFLQDGDLMEVEIENLGVLRNPVRGR